MKIAIDIDIIILGINEVTPYENNPRHNEKAVEYVANSLKQFGFKQPIVIDKDNIIVAGHTRYEAAKRLNLTQIPCVKADDLTDEQVKAYRLADNKTAEFSGWNFELLDAELDELLNFDMSLYGFKLDDNIDNIYTDNITVPNYEITGECPELSDLIDEDKTKELLQEIKEADIPQDIKKFLNKAAYRHYVFDYRDIAEYYAHSDKAVQDLMEKSGLVIIDYKKAIENGFIELHDFMKEDSDYDGE